MLQRRVLLQSGYSCIADSHKNNVRLVVVIMAKPYTPSRTVFPDTNLARFAGASRAGLCVRYRFQNRTVPKAKPVLKPLIKISEPQVLRATIWISLAPTSVVSVRIRYSYGPRLPGAGAPPTVAVTRISNLTVIVIVNGSPSTVRYVCLQ